MRSLSIEFIDLEHSTVQVEVESAEESPERANTSRLCPGRRIQFAPSGNKRSRRLLPRDIRRQILADTAPEPAEAAPVLEGMGRRNALSALGRKGAAARAEKRRAASWEAALSTWKGAAGAPQTMPLDQKGIREMRSRREEMVTAGAKQHPQHAFRLGADAFAMRYGDLCVLDHGISAEYGEPGRFTLPDRTFSEYANWFAIGRIGADEPLFYVVSPVAEIDGGRFNTSLWAYTTPVVDADGTPYYPNQE